jgi:two-component system response regulator FixJ
MNPVINIIDDDRLARESLKWLAESAHLSVREFECGHAFLDHFDNSIPGCVVLDVRMPDINGLELYTRLKESGANIPVIIVTGHADVAMGDEGRCLRLC